MKGVIWVCRCGYIGTPTEEELYLCLKCGYPTVIQKEMEITNA